MKTYLKCLKTHFYEQTPCKDAAKAYMQCRMDRALFEAQEMHQLGFQTPADAPVVHKADGEERERDAGRDTGRDAAAAGQ